MSVQATVPVDKRSDRRRSFSCKFHWSLEGWPCHLYVLLQTQDRGLECRVRKNKMSVSVSCSHPSFNGRMKSRSRACLLKRRVGIVDVVFCSAARPAGSFESNYMNNS